MGSVDAPEHLPADVAVVWVEVVTSMGGHPPRTSIADLEAYAGQVARLRDAQRRLAAEGLVIADPKGNPIAHPALAIERAAQEQIRKWGTRFMGRPL